MQQRNEQLIGQQVQQNMNINPTIASISIPDDKPLSPISVVKPQQNIHIYNKDYEGKIGILKQLGNYNEQDYPNGTFYGQMLNGKKHGQGLMLLQGRVCEGFWQNDRKHGHCKEIFDTGETFEGEYQNGKPQGKGIYIRNNESYEGQWVNGFKHGHGIWKLGNDFYEGEWKFGKIDGYGVYIQNNNIANRINNYHQFYINLVISNYFKLTISYQLKSQQKFKLFSQSSKLSFLFKYKFSLDFIILCKQVKRQQIEQITRIGKNKSNNIILSLSILQKN